MDSCPRHPLLLPRSQAEAVDTWEQADSLVLFLKNSQGGRVTPNPRVHFPLDRLFDFPRLKSSSTNICQCYLFKITMINVNGQKNIYAYYSETTDLRQWFSNFLSNRSFSQSHAVFQSIKEKKAKCCGWKRFLLPVTPSPPCLKVSF